MEQEKERKLKPLPSKFHYYLLRGVENGEEIYEMSHYDQCILTRAAEVPDSTIWIVEQHH